MFSKILLVSTLILSSLSFVGCNLPLNEQPPEVDDIQVGLGDATACLSNVMPVFSSYFAGTAKDAQVIGMWDCMDTAVSTFEKSTRGRFEDRFTARELAHFIEQYFLNKGDKIPDSLLTEVFRIKQLFVGGALDSLTRTEMKNLLAVIQELKRISLGMNPHMKIYTFSWKTRDLQMNDVDTQMFEDANSAIQQAAKDLAIVIEKNGQPYHLQNAIVLLHELSSFSQTPWAWISQVEKAMPLVEKLKKALAGGDAGEIAPNEWRRFALLSARGYVQYLRYYYFIQSADLTTGGTHLTYLVRSIDDLFSYLGDMVDSKPGQVLTRAEVLDMVQALSDFMPKIKISDELLVEAMKIKVVFFGGSVDVFRKDDFERARKKLEAFQILTQKFLNYSSLYSLTWKPASLAVPDALNYFKNAESNLSDFSQALSAIMENSYDLNDLMKLAAEIDRLYPSQNPNSRSLKALADQFVPVVISFKNILFSDQTSVIGQNTTNPQQQWGTFFKTVSELYSRYLYYSYFLENESLTQEPGLLYFNRLSLDVTYFLDRLIRQKPAQMISFDELSRLWTSLSRTGILPAKISIQTLNGLTKVLVQKILVPPDQRLNHQIPAGFSTVSTEVLRSELSMWVDNQKFLGLIYQGIPDTVGKPGSALLADLNSAAPTVSLMEMKMIYSGPLPLSFDEVGRLYLSRPALNYRQPTSNLINLVRAAVRLVIRSYAMSMSRITTYQGINLDEANALFADVKPAVVDLELLSAGSTDFAANRFRDANLFTAVSNGDDLANFQEMSNLFLMIISGIKIDSLLFENLDKSCAINKPTTLKDSWTVKLDCLSANYATQMPQQFVSMPDFLAFQSTLDAPRAQAMFLGLLKATGTMIDANNNVGVGDLVLFPNVVQYLEGIFQVYDQDRNGLLNTAEALKAYPTYRSTLKTVSGLTDEQQLKGLFTWLLKYGKPPTGADQLKFIVWWVPKGEKGWDVNANREMLAKILGFIADAMNKPKPAMKSAWRMDLDTQN